MSTHKYIDIICILVLLLTLLATVVFMNGEKLGIKAIADEDAESSQVSTYFTSNDLDGDWEENAYTTHITLGETEGEIQGNGAYFLNGDLVISNGGWYVISGTLKDGKIIVDANDSSKIWIRLKGVTINCSDDAALRIDQADKVFLTLAEGSVNTFTSGSSYSEDALSDNTGGAVFSHDDLTINGSGSLAIQAGYKYGIDVNDSLVITGGNISVTAPKDGIHVNDSFRYAKASLTIESGDDGIHSDDELYVESGTILIPSCIEGLEALVINIAGGDITIYPSDDGVNANGGSDTQFANMRRQHIPFPSETGQEQTNLEQTDENNRQYASSEMTNGQTASTAFPKRMEVSSEEIRNKGQSEQAGAANGGENETGQPESSSDSEEKETYIRISGGTLTIINETGQDADGLDSNGNIYIDGGEIYISLLGDAGNCAIDWSSENGGECIVTGGTILAFGGSGMAEAFSADCTQCSVLYNLEETAEAKTLFRLLDAEGNEVVSYTPKCSYSSISFSLPDLQLKRTYTIVCGDSATELTLDKTSVSAGKSGGMGEMQHGNKQGMHPGNRQGMNPGGMGPGPAQQSDKEQSTETQDSSGNSTTQELSGSKEEVSDQTGNTSVSLTEVDNHVRLLLGTSFLLLAAGILFAVKYRK